MASLATLPLSSCPSPPKKTPFNKVQSLQSTQSIMTSSTLENQAAFLMSLKSHPFKVLPAPTPVPRTDQILIRVHAVAINPCDSVIQSAGVIQETFPGVIGCDVAGEVVKGAEEDDASTGFKKGNRVIAAVESGAFQKYCVADKELVAKLPDEVPYEKGVVIPACLGTAMIALWHPREMGLEFWPGDGKKKNGKVVLVWGGGSCVGSCAVQMLKAAGYEVAVTASERNHGYLKEELGVDGDMCFDYKKGEGVVGEILEGVKKSGKEFAGAFCAVIDVGSLKMCGRIVDGLGTEEKSRVLGTVLPPNLPWIPDADELVPAGVRLAYCRFTADLLPKSKLRVQFGWGEDWEENVVGKEIWEKWVTPALDSGVLKCKPEPEIVGHGLEKIQDAVDIMAKGVSAKKLVVTIP